VPLPIPPFTSNKKKQKPFLEDNQALLGTGLGLGIGGAALAGVGRGILNGQEVDTVRNFLTMTDKWHQPGIDLRQVGREYPQFASDYVKVRPFGHTPVEVMRGIRSTSLGGDRFPWRDPTPVWQKTPKTGPGASEEQALNLTPEQVETLNHNDNHPFMYRPKFVENNRDKGQVIDPGSREHYDRFGEGGVSAYLHYLAELKGSFNTGKYRQTIGTNPNGPNLNPVQYQEIMKDWGGMVKNPEGKDVNLFPPNIRSSPDAVQTIRNVAHDTQPTLNPNVPVPTDNNDTLLHAAVGAEPVNQQLYRQTAQHDTAFYPMETAPGFNNIIAEHARNFARDSFKITKPLEQLTPEENRNVLSGLDEYIKLHDPNVWRQKQWADMNLGMWGQEASNSYGMLGHMGLMLHDLGNFVGIPAGIAGGALLAKYIWNKLKKPMTKKAGSPLTHNGGASIPKSLINKAMKANVHGPVRNRVMPHLSGRKVRINWVGGSSPIEKMAVLFPQLNQPKKKKEEDGFSMGRLGLAGLGAVAGYGLSKALMNSSLFNKETPATGTPTVAQSAQGTATGANPPTSPNISPIVKNIPFEPTALHKADLGFTPESNTVANTANVAGVANLGAHAGNALLRGAQLVSKIPKFKIPTLPGPVSAIASEAMHATKDPNQGLTNSLARSTTLWNRAEYPSAADFLAHPGDSFMQAGGATVKPWLVNPHLWGPLGTAANTAADIIQDTRAGNVNARANDAMKWQDTISTDAPNTTFGKMYDSLAHKLQALPQDEHAYLGSQNKAPMIMGKTIYNHATADNSVGRDIRRSLTDAMIGPNMGNKMVPQQEGDTGFTGHNDLARQESLKLTAGLRKANPEAQHFTLKTLPNNGGNKWFNTTSGHQFRNADDFFNNMPEDKPTETHLQTLMQLKQELPYMADNMFDESGIKKLFDKGMYTPHIAEILRQAGLLDNAKIDRLQAMGISPR
jgi:hypothetical protein